VPEVAVALARRKHARPILKVGRFALWLLREKVIGKSDRQLAIPLKLFDYLAVLRIVPEAPRVDRAGDPEPVQTPA
jgi:hypothetical protein